MSYVVRPVTVKILSVIGPDAAREDIELGRQMLERGAERAFKGTGKSARIHVTDFVIHPVDFNPSRVEEFTFRGIRDALREGGG